ncbi:hypothetical protein D9M73_155190 [compost metagenome]
MTGHAGGVVNLVAALDQLLQGPVLAGQLLELGRLGLALGKPGVVIGLGLDLDHHRHEAVVLAAQLGALAAVDAWLFDTGPGFVDKAWDGVALDREGRHPPGVDHIGSSDQEAHFRAHRQHQRLVDFQQVMLILRRLVVDLVGGGGQIAEELHILAQVFVVPFPLVAGDLDVDVRLAGVIDVDQGLGSRNGHHHQNQEGHHRPENFHPRVLVEMRGLLASGAAVDDHRPEHRAEHDDADDHADPEDGHVQVEHGVGDFRRPWVHVHGPGGVGLTKNRPQQEAHPDMWMSHHCGFPF